MAPKQDLNRPVKEFATPIDTIVKGDDTVEQSLAALRGKEIRDKIVYFYVVDDNEKLIGVVPTRKLLLSSPQDVISDIMERAVTRLHVDQSLEEAMQLFASRGLLALPVVDDEGRLVGSVDVQMYMEESVDIADARHRRDIFQIIGLSMEEGKKISTWGVYRHRMPWLFCNIIGGFICAIIADINDQVLGKVLLLAFFIPLVLTLSESVSMQAMTQSLHFLRRPKMTLKIAMMRALKEWQIVAMIAFSCGLIVGIFSLLWGEGVLPSMTIAFGIMISVTITAGIGIIMPILLFSTRLDPKVSSGPIVLMFADVLTTLLYLSLATWWLL